MSIGTHETWNGEKAFRSADIPLIESGVPHDNTCDSPHCFEGPVRTQSVSHMCKVTSNHPLVKMGQMTSVGYVIVKLLASCTDKNIHQDRLELLDVSI